MSSALRRFAPLVLLGISLVWLCVDAPGPFVREAWFVLVMLALTIATRSITWRMSLVALSLGLGVAGPAMVAIGWALARAGLDISESNAADWALVPILEECVKLLPLAYLAWMYGRKSRLTLNPSDWLLAGCAAGAGFAMVENAQLVQHDAGVLRDMARQYGPSWLVPGAWGAAGYAGHAAATGLIAAGIGFSRSLGREARARGRSLTPSRVALVAPFAWVTAEHVLANLHVTTGSNATFALGNGRLTPWIFLAAVLVIIAGDLRLQSRAIAHSVFLRRRRAWTREALIGTRLPKRAALIQRLLVAAGELRLVNAVAWSTLDRLTAGERTR
jgi:RsiW-degrading membrane proteinase PrsW (M82 family)